MKKTKLPLLLIAVLIIGSLFLSACTGGAGIASSWPGVLVDSSSETVYVASNTHVYALNLTNGTEKWQFPEKADNRKTFFAPPALTADGQLIEGGYDHVLYSINPQNGQQNWTFAEAKDKYIGAAFTNGDEILAPNTNNTLYALTTSGAVKWKFETKHALWIEPLTDGERLYLASMDHHVYALDPTSGNQIWVSDDLGGAIVHSFTLAENGVLYVGTIGADLSAVDSANGKVLWKVETKGWLWSKPVVKEDTIYIADQDGNVYAFDAANGNVRWQIQPDTTDSRPIVSTPLLVDETLYFASQAGIFYAVNAANGSPLWSKTIGGKIYSDLKSAGDMILIAPLETDALMYAVDLQGNSRWSFVPAK